MSQEKETGFHSEKSDVEAGTVDAGTVTTRPPVFSVKYPGSGTAEDPYVVDWGKGDEENPYNWSTRRKWMITLQVCAHTLPIYLYSMKSLTYHIVLPSSRFPHSPCRFVVAHTRVVSRL